MKRSLVSFSLGIVMTLAVGLAFLPAFTGAAVPVPAPIAIGTPFYSQLTSDMNRDPVLQRNCKAEYDASSTGGSSGGSLAGTGVNGGVPSSQAIYQASVNAGREATIAVHAALYAVCLNDQANRKLDYVCQAVKLLKS